MSNIRYKSNGNYLVSVVSGESVIVPISNSVAQMTNLLILNDTGAFIINCVNDEPKSVADIAIAMSATYDIEGINSLNTDIQEFIDQMVNRGFFSIIND